MPNRVNIGNVATAFLTQDDVCQNSFGKYIKNCEELHARFKKELNDPGCTSCKKPAIYNKYRLLVRRNIVVEIDDESS